MPQRTRNEPTAEREIEALKSYKWNFDGLVHEFNLLHTRAGQYINMNWMAIAAYLPVLGVTLANLQNPHLRLFACAYLGVVASLGLVATLTSIPGTVQARAAIERYLRNQHKIEDELGDNAFIADVCLGRTRDPLGKTKEHESSLLFYTVLPFVLIGIWITLLVFAAWLFFIPSKP